MLDILYTRRFDELHSFCDKADGMSPVKAWNVVFANVSGR